MTIQSGGHVNLLRRCFNLGLNIHVSRRIVFWNKVGWDNIARIIWTLRTTLAGLKQKTLDESCILHWWRCDLYVWHREINEIRECGFGGRHGRGDGLIKQQGCSISRKIRKWECWVPLDDVASKTFMKALQGINLIILLHHTSLQKSYPGFTITNRPSHGMEIRHWHIECRTRHCRRFYN